jgi:hypothetical protein
VNKDLTKVTVQIIAQLPGVELLLAEHPRSSLFESGTFADLSNVLWSSDEYTSESLLKTGDLFLDMGTSISFEAIVRDKPVLSMDYLHGNVTTTGQYLNSARMETVDNLYETLAQILTGEQTRTYTHREREMFLNEMIRNSSSTNVLSRYIRLITSFLKSDSTSDIRIESI